MLSEVIVLGSLSNSKFLRELGRLRPVIPVPVISISLNKGELLTLKLPSSRGQLERSNLLR